MGASHYMGLILKCNEIREKTKHWVRGHVTNIER